MQQLELFNGSDFEPKRDSQRLSAQHNRIKKLMLDGQARTLSQIAEKTGDPEASVSAQLRHLRKERFGAYTVSKNHLGNGLYTYKVSK
jgi:hypothetical protein